MSVAKTRAKSAHNKPPSFRPPQLATLVDTVPPGEEWVHEIKYDGYRLLIAVGEGKAYAYTRSGLDWSDKFTPLIEASAQLKVKSALIDGEAVVLDEKGRSRFQLMQGAFKNKSAKPIFYAFDLLEMNGADLTKLSLIERKQALAKLIGKRQSGVIRFSEHFEDGAGLFRELCNAGGEGIIAKRANGRYIGARSETWLKVKCLKRQEFVIAGWTESDKDRGFRSLILAVHDKGALRFAGKVGTGFTMAEIDRLLKRMKPLARASASIGAPRATVKGAHWIEPKLVAEVTFTEMTSDGVLRHPSYIGLREDKPAKDVIVEHPKRIRPTVRKKTKR
jgi:bifunctional non-homologous end joining protein LigD